MVQKYERKPSEFETCHSVYSTKFEVQRLQVCGALPPLPRVFMVWCLIEHRHNFTFVSEQHNCEEISYNLSNLIFDGKHCRW